MKTERAAQVAVFLPLRNLFSYSYRPEDSPRLVPGVRVVVPFGAREVVGVFLKFAPAEIEMKSIKAVLDERPIFPPFLIELALWSAEYYLAPPGEIFRMIGPRESLKKRVVLRATGAAPGNMRAVRKRILESLEGELTAAVLAKKAGLTPKELEKEAQQLVRKGLLEKRTEYYFTESRLKPEETESAGLSVGTPVAAFHHTVEQREAIANITAEIERRNGRVTLLEGRTGSGKTEVYIALCRVALAKGGGAIVLVPEIALTYQFVRRFRAVFPESVAVLHSGLSPARRREEWGRIARGEARVTIGARSAIFAPERDLRLIVVDEEHDSSYKQGDPPFYNARDLAVVLGRITGAPVVLGSATPSIETACNAKEGKYSRCELPNRIGMRPMPSVKLVVQDEESAMLPTDVVESLARRLERGEQSLVFINRRGAAARVRCRVCGETVRCPNCSISLVYHASGSKLLCHYCGHETPMPRQCAKCNARELFSFRGPGTQKVEALLAELLPKARIERLDQDTAPTREKAFAILERFEKGKTDIMVGTQMTAKGHDFENLTFTAILGADDYLSFPDFRSAERTFSLVTQAAGRTGRGERPGEVVIVGRGDHYAIRCAMGHDHASFYGQEILARKATGFPPFSRLIGIWFEAASEAKLEAEMRRLAAEMPRLPPSVMALGPAPALVHKVRNRFRWKLLLKGTNSRRLHEAALSVERAVDRSVSVSMDVDPYGFY